MLRWVIGKSARVRFHSHACTAPPAALAVSFFAARSQRPKEQNSEEGNIEKWNGSLSENSREQKWPEQRKLKVVEVV